MRYFDIKTQTESSVPSSTTIEATNKRVSKFFEPLKNGEKMIFGDDGLPYFYTQDFLRPIVTNGVVVEGMTTVEQSQIRKEARYARLDVIFNNKTLGLKKLAINKPNMKDAEAINNQYSIYEEMYKNAVKGWYDTTTNTAIITSNEGAKQALAPLTLLLNTIKSIIDTAITSDDVNADTMLDDADGISLSASDLTDAEIVEIKTMFGIA